MKKKEAIFAGPVDIKSYRPKKDEDYMNEKQVEHFEKILRIWKEQLMSDSSRTVHDMQAEAAVYPDMADRAYQEERFNLELKARDRERKLLKRIDEAIERIKIGDYGYCMDCGADIGIKRLEARPIATQCIECKTVAEIREKQTTGG
jgi:DnaK suppressor protein